MALSDATTEMAYSDDVDVGTNTNDQGKLEKPKKDSERTKAVQGDSNVSVDDLIGRVVQRELDKSSKWKKSKSKKKKRKKKLINMTNNTRDDEGQARDLLDPTCSTPKTIAPSHDLRLLGPLSFVTLQEDKSDEDDQHQSPVCGESLAQKVEKQRNGLAKKSNQRSTCSSSSSQEEEEEDTVPKVAKTLKEKSSTSKNAESDSSSSDDEDEVKKTPSQKRLHFTVNENLTSSSEDEAMNEQIRIDKKIERDVGKEKAVEESSSSSSDEDMEPKDSVQQAKSKSNDANPNDPLNDEIQKRKTDGNSAERNADDQSSDDDEASSDKGPNEDDAGAAAIALKDGKERLPLPRSGEKPSILEDEESQKSRSSKRRNKTPSLVDSVNGSRRRGQHSQIKKSTERTNEGLSSSDNDEDISDKSREGQPSEKIIEKKGTKSKHSSKDLEASSESSGSESNSHIEMGSVNPPTQTSYDREETLKNVKEKPPVRSHSSSSSSLSPTSSDDDEADTAQQTIEEHGGRLNVDDEDKSNDEDEESSLQIVEPVVELRTDVENETESTKPHTSESSRKRGKSPTKAKKGKSSKKWSRKASKKQKLEELNSRKNDDNGASDSTLLFKSKRYFNQLSPLRRKLIHFPLNEDFYASLSSLLDEVRSHFHLSLEASLRSLPQSSEVDKYDRNMSELMECPLVNGEFNWPLCFKLSRSIQAEDFLVPPLLEVTLKHQPHRHLRKEFRIELERKFEHFKSGKFNQAEEVVLLHRFLSLLHASGLSNRDQGPKLLDEMEGLTKRGIKGGSLNLKLWVACYVGQPMLHYRRPFDIYEHLQRLVCLFGAKSIASQVDSAQCLLVLRAIQREEVSYDDAKKNYWWVRTLVPQRRMIDSVLESMERKNGGAGQLPSHVTITNGSNTTSADSTSKRSKKSTDDLIDSIVRCVSAKIGWSSLSSCQFQLIPWREVNEELNLPKQRARRVFKRNIEPVLRTHFSNEDVDDLSWQLELLERIVKSNSISTRLDVDWKALQRVFPLQTTQSLIQFIENQYYTSIRRLERIEDLSMEDLWSVSHRFKEALEMAYERQRKRYQREGEEAAKFTAPLALKRAKRIIKVLDECRRRRSHRHNNMQGAIQ